VKAADEAGKDPFVFHAALVGLVGVLGVLGAYFLPREPSDRLAAFIGVGAAVFSGAIALPLKQRAMARSIKAALAVLGVVFGVRMVLVGAGLVFAKMRGLGMVSFTMAFFGAYFVLQWVEISYVLAEQKRRGS
jgi:hypothetical protein